MVGKQIHGVGMGSQMLCFIVVNEVGLMVGSNNNSECDSIFRTLLLGSVPQASISGSAHVRRIEFADPKIGQIRLDFKQDPIHQEASILRWSLRRFRLQLIKTEKWIFIILLLGQEISVFDLRCTSSFSFSFLIQKKVLFIIFQLFHNIWIRSLKACSSLYFPILNLILISFLI
jgi:hypothetical protein